MSMDAELAQTLLMRAISRADDCDRWGEAVEVLDRVENLPIPDLPELRFLQSVVFELGEAAAEELRERFDALVSTATGFEEHFQTEEYAEAVAATYSDVLDKANEGDWEEAWQVLDAVLMLDCPQEGDLPWVKGCLEYMRICADEGDEAGFRGTTEVVETYFSAERVTDDQPERHRAIYREALRQADATDDWNQAWAYLKAASGLQASGDAQIDYVAQRVSDLCDFIDQGDFEAFEGVAFVTLDLLTTDEPSTPAEVFCDVATDAINAAMVSESWDETFHLLDAAIKIPRSDNIRRARFLAESLASLREMASRREEGLAETARTVLLTMEIADREGFSLGE